MSFPVSSEQGAAAADAGEPVHGGAASLSALGLRLRQAREARGLSAPDLADRLRLGVEQLEALETGDRERLPEPVFVIAQARRVAGALRLDITPELQALRASGELQRSPRSAASIPSGSLRPGPPSVTAVAPTDTVKEATAAASADPGLHPGGWLRLVVGAVLLLVVALLWAGWRLRGAVARDDHPSQRQAGAAAQALPRPSPPAAAGPDVAPVAAGMVVLASREPSWLEVRRPDGTILFRGLLRGARLFSLEGGLELMAARPDLVTSRTGSTAARPLGPISDVRWRSLAAVP